MLTILMGYLDGTCRYIYSTMTWIVLLMCDISDSIRLVVVGLSWRALSQILCDHGLIVHLHIGTLTCTHRYMCLANLYMIYACNILYKLTFDNFDMFSLEKTNFWRVQSFQPPQNDGLKWLPTGPT